MKKILTSKKKSENIIHLLIGSSTAILTFYITYRAGTFIFNHIELPQVLENFVIVVAIIGITLFSMSLLLRFDSRPIRQTIRIQDNISQKQNFRSFANLR